MKQRILILLALVLLLAVSRFVFLREGPGPRMYDVTGIVTHQDGKSLPLGRIMFVPENGPPSKLAAIDENGRYRLRAVAGEHRVQIIAVPLRSDARPDPTAEGGMDYTGLPEPESLILKKYNRYDTSGITVVVRAEDANAININLD